MSSGLPQYVLTFISNIGPLLFGIHIGWLAPFEPALKSPLSPFKKQLTEEEISWLAALPTAALLVATPFFGYLLQKFGRKSACMIANVPNTIVFAILLLSDQLHYALFARVLSGIASAGALIVTPVYVSECVDDAKRGILCGLTALFINIGVVLAYCLGSYTSYFIVNITSLGLSILFLIGYSWLPESPVHLVRIGKKGKAEKSLRKLRGDTKEGVAFELSVICLSIKTADCGSETMGVTAVIKDQALRKALLLGLGIMTTQQLCGITPSLAYLVQILQDSKSYPSPYLVAVIIAVVQLVSSVIGPVLLAFFGRRTILMTSGVAISIALVAFTFYLGFGPSSPSPIPSVALSVFFFAYCMGYGTVPFALLPEIVPSEARGVVIAIVGTWVGTLAFVVTKCFPLFNSYFTLCGTFSFFTLSSVLGTIFVYFLVFETKGKTQAEINDLLRGKSSSDKVGI